MPIIQVTLPDEDTPGGVSLATLQAHAEGSGRTLNETINVMLAAMVGPNRITADEFHRSAAEFQRIKQGLTDLLDK